MLPSKIQKTILVVLLIAVLTGLIGSMLAGTMTLQSR